MSFTDFLKKNKNSAAAVSTEDLLNELDSRMISQNPFPLDVFNPKIKPFLTDLTTKMDVPRSFAGLGMLMAYSTAIGTAYVINRSDDDKMCLSLWGCFNGMTSSGKSMALKACLAPLNKIQSELDREWEELTADMSDDKRSKEKMKTLIYRDVHIPTLVRTVIPASPKGLLKEADEILEWINGLNSLSKKEGTDEQFWLSAWNGLRYSAIRSGSVKISIPRVFNNVVGGIQPDLLYKLFKNDRGESGFIFRILFANLDVEKIAEPARRFSLPKEYKEIHERCIFRLYNELPVESATDPAKQCFPTDEAADLFFDWKDEKNRQINAMENPRDRNIYAGVLGKISEYAYRFAAILRISDIAYKENVFDETNYFPDQLEVNTEVMERALKLANYFYNSAISVYFRVDTTINAPYEVLFMSSLLRAGKSIAQMAEIILGSKYKKSTMQKQLERAIKNYPKVFGAGRL